MKLPQSIGSIASLWTALSSSNENFGLRERLRLQLYASYQQPPSALMQSTARVLHPSSNAFEDADMGALRAKEFPGMSDGEVRQATAGHYPEPRTLRDCCALYAERALLGLPDTESRVGLCAHYFAHRMFGAAITNEELDFFDSNIWPRLLDAPADYETVVRGLRQSGDSNGVMVDVRVLPVPELLGWTVAGIDRDKADSLIDGILESF